MLKIPQQVFNTLHLHTRCNLGQGMKNHRIELGEPEWSSSSVFANRDERFIKKSELVLQTITCPVIAGQIECRLPRLNLLT